jgi:fibronectin-binding autotransporter adhesin
MTAISWNNATSGNWSTAADWSTDTVPTSADDVTIAVFTATDYTVSINTAAEANSPTVGVSAEVQEDNSGSLTISGALTVNGTASITLVTQNSIGSVVIDDGGVVALDGGTLGSGTVTLVNGGELFVESNATISNTLDISGSPDEINLLNTTLIVDGVWTLNANAELFFSAFVGNSSQNVVVWHTPGGSAINGAGQSIVIDGVTLRAGDDRLSVLLGGSPSEQVIDNGAIDVAGFPLAINNLEGSGTVTDSGAATNLDLFGANFSGSITGPLAVALFGAVTLNGASSYTGGTSIGGTVTIGSGSALGTGTVTIGGGGELIVGAPETDNIISNALNLSGNVEIGTDESQFNVAGPWTLNAGAVLDFVSVAGNSNQNFVFWKSAGGSGFNGSGETVEVSGITLVAGDDRLALLLAGGVNTQTIDNGVIDENGFPSAINDLQGSGIVTDSGAAAVLDLFGANFAGTLSGPLSVFTFGTVILTGIGDNSGGFTISTGTLELGSGGSVTGNVSFSGTDTTLRLDTGTNQVGGEVMGAVAGDAIDFHFVNFAAGDQVVWDQTSGTAGTLSLFKNGTDLATLDMAGQFTSADFKVSNDGSGGALVTVLTASVPAAAPEITSSGGVTSQPVQMISGTASASATVTVFDGTTQVGTAKVQADGDWSVGVTLLNGVQTITAEAGSEVSNALATRSARRLQPKAFWSR